MSERGHLLLERTVARDSGRAVGTSVDPVMLEIFNGLFMSIAEQMARGAAKHGVIGEHQRTLGFQLRGV